MTRVYYRSPKKQIGCYDVATEDHEVAIAEVRRALGDQRKSWLVVAVIKGGKA